MRISQVRQIGVVSFPVEYSNVFEYLGQWHRHHGITVDFRPPSVVKNEPPLIFPHIQPDPWWIGILNLSDRPSYASYATQHLASVCQALGRTKTIHRGDVCLGSSPHHICCLQMQRSNGTLHPPHGNQMSAAPQLQMSR